MRTVTSLFLVIFFFGCSPVKGPDKAIVGGVLGAGWGAGSGAVIGNQLGDPGPGAAIGAGFGFASGMLTGAGMDLVEEDALRQHKELQALRLQAASNARSLEQINEELDGVTTYARTASTESRIYFDKGRASLRYGSVIELERIANSFKADPNVEKILLQGHSDNTGDEDLNLRLSEARARSVATFLAKNGISTDQIEVDFFGAKRPLATNTTSEGKQLNRRVEVVVKR